MLPQLKWHGCAYGCVLVSGIPFLVWWGERFHSSDSDVLIGLAGIGGALLLVLIRRFDSSACMRESESGCRKQTLWCDTDAHWKTATLLTLLYGWLVVMEIPPTVYGAFWLALLFCLPGPWRERGRLSFPIAGMLLMSLPSVLTVELILGYPMRWMGTVLASGLLRIMQFDVVREGVMLETAGQLVWVDVPCSGIRMLWSHVWLALFLAGFFRLGQLRTVLLCVVMLAVVVAENALRIVGLVLLTFMPPLSLAHSAVGVSCFISGSIFLVWLAWRFGRNPLLRGSNQEHVSSFTPASQWRYGFMIASIATAIAIGWGVTREQCPALPSQQVHWPDTFEGERLIQVPLTEQESRFMRRLPGRIGKFSAGHRSVILREVNKVSRFVHSASYCLQAEGWTIEPLPLFEDANGVRWQRYEAVRRDKRWQVRECCVDRVTGKTWPDIASWYWAVLLGHTRGPWQIITVAE